MGQTLSQKSASYPVSRDLEDRTRNQSTTAPAPSLRDRVRSEASTLATKTRMFGDLIRYRNQYAREDAADAATMASARKMYSPGRDAASAPAARKRTVSARKRTSSGRRSAGR